MKVIKITRLKLIDFLTITNGPGLRSHLTYVYYVYEYNLIDEYTISTNPNSKVSVLISRKTYLKQVLRIRATRVYCTSYVTKPVRRPYDTYETPIIRQKH